VESVPAASPLSTFDDDWWDHVVEQVAVEFAVDYAAGTCRVAFYTPAAVAGGFVKPPHAKMELRFEETVPDGEGHWGYPMPRALCRCIRLCRMATTVVTFGALPLFDQALTS
jgi:hypothetical protein